MSKPHFRLHVWPLAEIAKRWYVVYPEPVFQGNEWVFRTHAHTTARQAIAEATQVWICNVAAGIAMG